MKKVLPIKIFLVCCIVAITSKSIAQDPHFSQYYSSEATTNPAFTGLYKGQYKISGLYRQQWPQFGQPFVSGLITAEMKLKAEDENYFGGIWSAGVSVLYDKTPEDVFKSTLVMAHLAYQIPLDENGYHTLSAGVMGGYGQRRINTQSLTFGSQFTPDGFDTNIPSGEIITATQQNYWDVNAGLVYTYENENNLLYGGASVYHITQPKISFLQNNKTQNKLPMRYNIQAGFNVSSESLQYAGSVLYMQQGGANYIYAGVAVGFPFGTEDGIVYTGLWWRKEEALVPAIQLQYHAFNIGISYDVPSTRQTFTRPKSMELSMSYRFSKLKDYGTRCPRL